MPGKMKRSPSLQQAQGEGRRERALRRAHPRYMPEHSRGLQGTFSSLTAFEDSHGQSKRHTVFALCSFVLPALFVGVYTVLEARIWLDLVSEWNGRVPGKTETWVVSVGNAIERTFKFIDNNFVPFGYEYVPLIIAWIHLVIVMSLLLRLYRRSSQGDRGERGREGTISAWSVRSESSLLYIYMLKAFTNAWILPKKYAVLYYFIGAASTIAATLHVLMSVVVVINVIQSNPESEQLDKLRNHTVNLRVLQLQTTVELVRATVRLGIPAYISSPLTLVLIFGYTYRIVSFTLRTQPFYVNKLDILVSMLHGVVMLLAAMGLLGPIMIASDRAVHLWICAALIIVILVIFPINYLGNPTRKRTVMRCMYGFQVLAALAAGVTMYITMGSAYGFAAYAPSHLFLVAHPHYYLVAFVSFSLYMGLTMYYLYKRYPSPPVVASSESIFSVARGDDSDIIHILSLQSTLKSSARHWLCGMHLELVHRDIVGAHNHYQEACLIAGGSMAKKYDLIAFNQAVTELPWREVLAHVDHLMHRFWNGNGQGSVMGLTTDPRILHQIRHARDGIRQRALEKGTRVIDLSADNHNYKKAGSTVSPLSPSIQKLLWFLIYGDLSSSTMLDFDTPAAERRLEKFLSQHAFLSGDEKKALKRIHCNNLTDLLDDLDGGPVAAVFPGTQRRGSSTGNVTGGRAVQDGEGSTSPPPPIAKLKGLSGRVSSTVAPTTPHTVTVVTHPTIGNHWVEHALIALEKLMIHRMTVEAEEDKTPCTRHQTTCRHGSLLLMSGDVFPASWQLSQILKGELVEEVTVTSQDNTREQGVRHRDSPRMDADGNDPTLSPGASTMAGSRMTINVEYAQGDYSIRTDVKMRRLVETRLATRMIALAQHYPLIVLISEYDKEDSIHVGRALETVKAYKGLVSNADPPVDLTSTLSVLEVHSQEVTAVSVGTMGHESFSQATDGMWATSTRRASTNTSSSTGFNARRRKPRDIPVYKASAWVHKEYPRKEQPQLVDPCCGCESLNYIVYDSDCEETDTRDDAQDVSRSLNSSTLFLPASADITPAVQGRVSPPSEHPPLQIKDGSYQSTPDLQEKKGTSDVRRSRSHIERPTSIPLGKPSAMTATTQTPSTATPDLSSVDSASPFASQSRPHHTNTRSGDSSTNHDSDWSSTDRGGVALTQRLRRVVPLDINEDCLTLLVCSALIGHTAPISLVRGVFDVITKDKPRLDDDSPLFESCLKKLLGLQSRLVFINNEWIVFQTLAAHAYVLRNIDRSVASERAQRVYEYFMSGDHVTRDHDGKPVSALRILPIAYLLPLEDHMQLRLLKKCCKDLYATGFKVTAFRVSSYAISMIEDNEQHFGPLRRRETGTHQDWEWFLATEFDMYRWQGDGAVNVGLFSLAKESFEKADAIRTKQALKSDKRRYGEWLCSLSFMYTQQGNFTEGIRYACKAMDLACEDKATLRPILLNALRNRARAHHFGGQYKDAIKYYKEAIAEARAYKHLDNLKEEAKAMSCMARSMLSTTAESHKARAILAFTTSLQKWTSNRTYILDTLLSQGQAWMVSWDFYQAENLLDSVVDAYEVEDVNNGKMYAVLALLDLYCIMQRTGEYETNRLTLHTMLPSASKGKARRTLSPEEESLLSDDQTLHPRLPRKVVRIFSKALQMREVLWARITGDSDWKSKLNVLLKDGDTLPYVAIALQQIQAISAALQTTRGNMAKDKWVRVFNWTIFTVWPKVNPLAKINPLRWLSTSPIRGWKSMQEDETARKVDEYIQAVQDIAECANKNLHRAVVPLDLEVVCCTAKLRALSAPAHEDGSSGETLADR